LSYEEFCRLRDAAPWWTRLNRTLEVHAMAQYRKAQPEILGGRPVRGYARLALAAACSPQLTFQRIGGVLRHRWHASPRTPARPAARETESGVVL
jgi:hypothetical protein